VEPETHNTNPHSLFATNKFTSKTNYIKICKALSIETLKCTTPMMSDFNMEEF
jgi:hypothetical protein